MAAAVAVPPVEVAGSHLRLGEGFVSTLLVTGYPLEVGPAWLEPLLQVPFRVDVAVFVEPLPGDVAAGRLRRQRARMESVAWSDADHARIPDPAREAAASDAAELADRLARGAARLFRVGVYVTVHAPTRADLAEAVAQVKAAAASVLLDLQPATWRQLQGWTSTLPLGTDSLHGARIMDTDALAAAFPLASPDLPAPLPGDPPPSDWTAGGILYGANIASGGIVWWDRWAQDNYNSVVLARSGAGKSYLVKLDVLRNLYNGVQIAIIDPEAEYLRLADAVAGTTINLGAPGIRLNPLDIPPGERRSDALDQRRMFLLTLVTVLLGEQPSPLERTALDHAVDAAYARAGITDDPATWTRPAPLLRHVTTHLTHPATGGGIGSGEPGATLAARLAPWTEGSFKTLFDGPTTFHPRGHLIVWCTRDLPDELRAAGMLLALDAIWRDVDRGATSTSRPGRVGPRRLVVIDEAWTLLQQAEGSQFLARLAKAGRKRRAGLTVVTQDAADLLASDLGRVVVSNAATQILLRQAPQAIDLVAEQFNLTDGEARMLLSAPQGQALLLTGPHRVSFQAIASATEHHLAASLSDLPDTEHDPAGDLFDQSAGNDLYPGGDDAAAADYYGHQGTGYGDTGYGDTGYGDTGYGDTGFDDTDGPHEADGPLWHNDQHVDQHIDRHIDEMGDGIGDGLFTEATQDGWAPTQPEREWEAEEAPEEDVGPGWGPRGRQRGGQR